ncbi:MAG TPA: mobile mystery protein A [Longimicrobium sp.]|jgi:predicted DNA-binding mobile mystery protein A
MPQKSFARLRRKQVDALLGTLAPLRQVTQPSRGWIREIRTTLGLTTAQLAERLGLSQAGVSQLERREAAGSVTLNSLNTAADALGCDLVYALIPRAGSLSAVMEERARAIATAAVGRVSHTMRLEDQAVSAAAVQDQIEELTRDLLDNPRALWSGDVG